MATVCACRSPESLTNEDELVAVAAEEDANDEQRTIDEVSPSS